VNAKILEKAAFHLQRIFRAHRVQKKSKKSKSQNRKSTVVPTTPITPIKVVVAQVKVEQNFSEIEDEADDIVNWTLQPSRDDDFDQKMKMYLETEALQHFPNHKRKEKKKKKRLVGKNVGSESDSDGEEDLLDTYEDIHDPIFITCSR
jgi:hypothetical protein